MYIICLCLLTSTLYGAAKSPDSPVRYLQELHPRATDIVNIQLNQMYEQQYDMAILMKNLKLQRTILPARKIYTYDQLPGRSIALHAWRYLTDSLLLV